MLEAIPVPGNRQFLDGGAMFGHAPRAVWSRMCPPDALSRIELACRGVLVRDGSRNVLLETGIGAFFAPKLRERYGVVEDEHVLLRSLSRHGLGDHDIDVIVLSHLHFDHAGGLLEAHEEGAPLRLLFPRALFVTSAEAFARARTPHRRDRASFVEGLTELLEASGRLVLVPGGTATLPELGPRFSFSETQGHTPGLLHTAVHGESRTLRFLSDLVPGTPWLNPPITMGYDRCAETLVDEKTAVLEAAASAGDVVAFTHDREVAFATIARDERGGFHTGETWRDTDALDLDAPA